MTQEQVLADLDARIIELEYRNLKKKIAGQNRTRYTGKYGSPAKPAKAVPCEMNVTKDRGRTKYEIRNAVGGWTELPKDRRLWPAWAIEIDRICEEADAHRRRAGHGMLIGICNEPPEVR